MAKAKNKGFIDGQDSFVVHDEVLDPERDAEHVRRIRAALRKHDPLNPLYRDQQPINPHVRYGNRADTDDDE